MPKGLFRACGNYPFKVTEQGDSEPRKGDLGKAAACLVLGAELNAFLLNV